MGFKHLEGMWIKGVNSRNAIDDTGPLPNKAAGKSEYNGKTYYFCAPGCKKMFDKNPEKYV